MRFALLLVILPAFAQAAPRVKKRSRVPAARLVPASAQGQVTSVTAEATFLDRGSADGLTPGQQLTFTRAGKTAGTCTLTALAEHHARCTNPALRVGDRFAVARAEVPKPRAPAPLPGDAELQRRAAQLDDAEWTLREFKTGARLGAQATRAEVLLSHTTFGNLNSANGAFGVQRLDAAVYDVELWRGLRVSADVTALNFSARPGTPNEGRAATRTVYQQSPVLLVRQLELGFRRQDVPFSAALGRTWLRGVNGALVLDGAQAAWRVGEQLELGAYGGLLPQAARLEISPSQWTAGAFGRLRFSSGKGADATLGHLSLRAGYALREQLGSRAELSLGGSVWSGPRFDLHTSLEFGFGQTQALAGLDAARLELGWRPVEPLRLNAGVRYRGLPLSGLVELGTLSPGQRALHADASAAYRVSDGLLLSVHGGVASDFDSGLWQARVGPELSLPHLGRLPLGVAAGYLEELGWVRGRHGYLQLNLAPLGLFRVLSRVSWFNQQRQVGSEALAGHELGGTFALELTPWRFFSARVLVMGRLPLAEERAVLGSVGVQLGGAF